jgi:hypothetical protein
MKGFLLVAAGCLTTVSALEVLRPTPLRCEPVKGETRTWDTRHFRIVSEVDLPEFDLHRLAVVADSTARAVEAHPIAWFDPPRHHRPELRIFRDAESYENGGGAPGSAGSYVWREAAVALDAGHLFPPVDPQSRLRPMPDEATVVHEIVHLCMHGSQGRLSQWFSEGICEYYAAAHLGGGRFDFRDMDRQIRRHVRRRFGDEVELIPALPLDQIVGLDHRAWLRLMFRIPAEIRYHGYMSALLLTHYHLHGTERRKALEECFSTRPVENPQSFDRLGDTTSDLEKSLAAYWRSRGLGISFEKGP